jgi:hypothetical protein
VEDGTRLWLAIAAVIAAALLFHYRHSLLCRAQLAAFRMQQGEDYAAGEVVVVFQGRVTEGEANGTVRSHGLELEPAYAFDLLRSGRVRVPPGSECAWVGRLMRDPNVLGASVNPLMRAE